MEGKSPTDILRKEHDDVLKTLDKIENSLGNKGIGLLKESIAILENEFNAHSLNKEEKALFPEIEKFIPRDGGPTGIMIMEHKEIVELIRQFKENIKSKNFERLNEIGGNISSILRPHIDKENNILFMIADMHLDSNQKKAVLKKFKEFGSGQGSCN